MAPVDPEGEVRHGEISVNCPGCLKAKCLAFTYKLITECFYYITGFVFIYKFLLIHILLDKNCIAIPFFILTSSYILFKNFNFVSPDGVSSL